MSYTTVDSNSDTAVLRLSPATGRAHRLQRAILVSVHKLLRVIHAVLRDDRPYLDPDIDYEKLVVTCNAPRWMRMLTRHGFLAAARAAARG